LSNQSFNRTAQKPGCRLILRWAPVAGIKTPPGLFAVVSGIDVALCPCPDVDSLVRLEPRTLLSATMTSAQDGRAIWN